MPLICDGEPRDAPPLVIHDFLRDASLRLPARWGFRKRRESERGRVVGVVLHTTKGWPDHKHPAPQRVREEAAPPDACGARATVAYWRRGERFAGAHLVLDADGSVLCCADLLRDAAYHAGRVNGISVGVEVFQQRDASLYRAQLDALPVLVGAVSDLLGVPRRVALPYRGGPRDGVEEEPGVWGHRDLTDDRGFGDPGDLLPQALVAAGWEAF